MVDLGSAASSEVCESYAHVVQPTCGIRILGGHGRCPHALVREVLPRYSFDVRRNRQIDRRLRAPRRTLEEHPHESHDDRGPTDAEVRPDHPGMARVHRDAGALEMSRELSREQDLREFRLAIRAVAAVL